VRVTARCVGAFGLVIAIGCGAATPPPQRESIVIAPAGSARPAPTTTIFADPSRPAPTPAAVFASKEPTPVFFVVDHEGTLQCQEWNVGAGALRRDFMASCGRVSSSIAYTFEGAWVTFASKSRTTGPGFGHAEGVSVVRDGPNDPLARHVSIVGAEALTVGDGQWFLSKSACVDALAAGAPAMRVGLAIVDHLVDRANGGICRRDP